MEFAFIKVATLSQGGKWPNENKNTAGDRDAVSR